MGRKDSALPPKLPGELPRPLERAVTGAARRLFAGGSESGPESPPRRFPPHTGSLKMVRADRFFLHCQPDILLEYPIIIPLSGRVYKGDCRMCGKNSSLFQEVSCRSIALAAARRRWGLVPDPPALVPCGIARPSRGGAGGLWMALMGRFGPHIRVLPLYAAEQRLRICVLGGLWRWETEVRLVERDLQRIAPNGAAQTFRKGK